MRLFRLTNGDLLTTGDQFLTDAYTGEQKFYLNSDNQPTDKDGKPIAGQFLTQFVYTFDEYVALYPKAEGYRNWLTGKQERNGNTVTIIQGVPGWTCMPGYVYNVTRYNAFKHPKNDLYSMKPTIILNDGDDAYARKTFETNEEADAALEELKLLAPFARDELVAFGYTLD